MPLCGPNTLYVATPTQKGDPTCGGCGSRSINDPIGCKITARKSREQVREQLKDYCLLMLGAPVVKIELDEQQLDAAVDLALQIFEDYAGREYFDYHVFRTTPGKSVYTLPCDVGLIRNVFYKEQGTLAFQSSDLGGALPIEYYYPGGAYGSAQGGLLDPTQPIWGRMGEWTLYKQYEQMYSRLSSNLGGWEWIGGMTPAKIKLYPIPCKVHPVVVHYLQRKPDFKQVTQAMQEGSLIYAKEMVGRIRSKYPAPPGPGGGMQLDGATLLQESREDMKQWKEDLIYRYGDLPAITMD
jgi:hypothetical protein